MGMTIDEAIEIFKEIKYPTNGDNEYEREKAIQIMIKAVRKYQKIEQIIAMDDENHRRTIRLADLKEVIEDGNDD